MLTVCSAFAYATEWSERTLAATAAFTGAARLALISDIAARSGSASPASSSSSSRVMGRYSVCSPMCLRSFLGALVHRRVLRGAGDRRRVVRQDVRGDG